MYDDPVPTCQPAPASGQISSSQPSAAVNTAHLDVTLSSQPAGSQNSHPNLPAPPGNEISHTNPSSNTGSAPLSVKFITVSGSQVLHSSSPLPPGNLKLIPVQPAAATAAKSPLLSDNKTHMVLRVQDAQPGTNNKPSSGSVLVREDAASALVQTETPAADMQRVKHPSSPRDADIIALKKEPDFRCVGKIELRPTASGSVVLQAAEEAKDQTDANVGTISAAGSHSEDPATAVESDEHCTPATSASIHVPPEPLIQITSAKHILPICAAADARQKGIAVPVNSKSEVPVQSDLSKNVTATSAIQVPELGSDNRDANSTSVEGSDDNLPRSKMDSNPTDPQMSSASDTDDAEDRFESVVEGGFIRQTVEGDNEHSSTEITLEASIASRVQCRRNSKGSGVEPSVLVETVHTIPTHSTLTGMHSLQNSPRVPRSINSSPVAADSQEQSSHPDSKANSGEVETFSTSKPLHSGKTRDAGKEKDAEDVISPDNDARMSDPQHTESSSTEPGDSAKDVNLADAKTLQDSESAVTLLSLLKRGPNVNPACPPKSTNPIHTETIIKLESAQDSPNRSPSSSSETDSVAKDMSTDLMSEDLTSEMESTSSGKTRIGGGGICSTLLAVIEQLRERLGLVDFSHV